MRGRELRVPRRLPAKDYKGAGVIATVVVDNTRGLLATRVGSSGFYESHFGQTTGQPLARRLEAACDNTGVRSRRSRCERASWPGPGLPSWTGRRIRLLVWSEELSPLGSIVLMFGAGRVIGGGFWGRGSRVWCSRVLAWRGRRRVRRRGCRGSRGPRPCSSLGGGGARGRRTGSGCPVER